MLQGDSSSFVLDEGCDAELIEVMSLPNRWTEFPHARERERGLVILAGEVLHISNYVVAREPVLSMRCLRGLPEISEDGLDVEVWCWADGAEGQRLLSFRLENAQTDAGLHEIEMALPLSPGSTVRFEVRCCAGPLGQNEADWLGLTALVICGRDKLSLLRARTQHDWRLANEIQHFNQVYSSEFYRDRRHERSAAVVGEVRTLPSRKDRSSDNASIRPALLERLRCMSPTPGENTFAFAHRMLAEILPVRPPDFSSRLRAMAEHYKRRPLRMLSLCAGEAAVEGSILHAAAVPVEL